MAKKQDKGLKDPHVSPNKLASEEGQKDIKDSAHDKERLKPDEATIDLPDVYDIPGQANVRVPEPHSLGDETFASDDEEGRGLFEDDNDEPTIEMSDEQQLSGEERQLLRKSGETMPTEDEQRLERASLDNTDFENERLNEATLSNDRSGSDLDVPGESDDVRTPDPHDKGDEENQHFSLGSSDNDNIVEGTP